MGDTDSRPGAQATGAIRGRPATGYDPRREVYGEEYSGAKTSDQKRALAEKLLQKATDSKADLPSHFVLLKLARDVAAMAGEIDLAFKAVDATAETFDVKPVAMKHEAFTKAAQATRSSKQNELLAKAASSLMDEASAVDEFEVALEVGKRGLVAAKSPRQRTSRPEDHQGHGSEDCPGQATPDRSPQHPVHDRIQRKGDDDPQLERQPHRLDRHFRTGSYRQVLGKL